MRPYGLARYSSQILIMFVIRHYNISNIVIHIYMWYLQQMSCIGNIQYIIVSLVRDCIIDTEQPMV